MTASVGSTGGVTDKKLLSGGLAEGCQNFSLMGVGLATLLIGTVSPPCGRSAPTWFGRFAIALRLSNNGTHCDLRLPLYDLAATRVPHSLLFPRTRAAAR